MTRAPGGGLRPDVGERLSPVVTLALDGEPSCPVADCLNGANGTFLSVGGGLGRLANVPILAPALPCFGECLSFGHGASRVCGASSHLLKYNNRLSPNPLEQWVSATLASYLWAKTQGLTRGSEVH